MRKKKIKIYLITTFLVIFSLVGCSKLNKDINFENEVINDKVEIPNYFSLTDILARYDADGKNLYSLGTIHHGHILQSSGYSFQTLQSVIEHVKPDYVLIESREEIFEKYGAVDGPIEFQFIYSYCKDHHIPVKFIDVWSEYNDLPKEAGTTSDKRDNQIFYNIYDKIKQAKKGENILVCYGSAHFFYQHPRMESAGWKEVEIANEEEYFYSDIVEDLFTYPKCMSETIQNTINLYEKNLIEHAKENGTKVNIILQLQETFQSQADSYKIIKKIIDNNKLYISEEDIPKETE